MFVVIESCVDVYGVKAEFIIVSKIFLLVSMVVFVVTVDVVVFGSRFCVRIEGVRSFNIEIVVVKTEEEEEEVLVGIDAWRDETLSIDVGGVGMAVFDVRHGMWTLNSGT